ncbi:MAG: NAD(P)/FAD-dependent oxidoreductase [Sandaracinaceae bacterium]
MQTPDLLILGGGYAGVAAALRARRRLGPGARLTLVSDRDHLVERVRLHEAAARGRPVLRPLADLLRGTGVRWVHARAERLDPGGRLRTDAGDLAFGALIVAIGSRPDPGRLEGLAEHGEVLDHRGARRIGPRLGALPEGARVLVVGGGLTGIEAASEVAAAHPRLRVQLATRGSLGERTTARQRERLHRSLARLGVEVLEGTPVARLSAGAAHHGGGALPFDLCVFAGGFRPPALLAEAGLAVDPDGRAPVPPTLRAAPDALVWLAGDCAAVRGSPGSPVVTGCKTALPMGGHAADNAARVLQGRPERPFAWRDNGRLMSLGRRDGIFQGMTVEGEPSGVTLGGWPAAWLKEQVNRFSLGALAWERRAPFPFPWPTARRKVHVLPAEAS